MFHHCVIFCTCAHLPNFWDQAGQKVQLPSKCGWLDKILEAEWKNSSAVQVPINWTYVKHTYWCFFVDFWNGMLFFFTTLKVTPNSKEKSLSSVFFSFIFFSSSFFKYQWPLFPYLKNGPTAPRSFSFDWKWLWQNQPSLVKSKWLR